MAKTAAQKNRAKKVVAKKSTQQKKKLPKKISRKSSTVTRPPQRKVISKKKSAAKTKKQNQPVINQEIIDNELHNHLTALQSSILKWIEIKTKEFNKIKTSEQKASEHLSAAIERKKTVVHKLKQKRTAALTKQGENAKNNWETRKVSLKQIKIESILIKHDLDEVNKARRKFAKLIQVIKKFNLDWLKDEQNKKKSIKKIKKPIQPKKSPHLNQPININTAIKSDKPKLEHKADSSSTTPSTQKEEALAEI